MEKKRDNSHLEEKVLLRLQTVDLIKKSQITVLECFAGDGTVWSEVKLRTKKAINLLKIDKRANRKGIYLRGHNLKYMRSMDLSQFDIIDLDAYGIPFDQLEAVFEQPFTGYVHVTCNNQTGMGTLPYKLLEFCGIPERWYKKTRLLFSKNLIEKTGCYLYEKGIREITGYFIGGKNYFWFFME
jgi:hypothetical protein